MKYFLVKTQCGHVGRNHYIEIIFPVVAENGSEAALKARWIPRVKHDRKDAIVSVIEVGIEKYELQLEINRSDPYLQAQCPQDQAMIENFSDRIMDYSPSDEPRRRKRDTFFKRRKERAYQSLLDKEMRYYSISETLAAAF